MDSWNITSVIKSCHDIINEGDVENEEHICQVEEDNLDIWEYYEKYIHKIPCCTSTRSGHKLIHEIMADLQHNYGLNPTRGMSIYEEVDIFLMTCAHGVDNCLIQEMFNHSGETVHRHLHRILGVINKLAKNIIKPHPYYNDGVGYHMP
ncbi:hypothetical protein RJ641_034019 [Dillenia turbinata]|uniref:DUF8040 domain-containing protein n=1 Tax=Dillenia turbinata TaxID=194707 RepID=A0AAN8ZDU5_9MAGN